MRSDRITGKRMTAACILAVLLLVIFVLLWFLAGNVDVQAIGPEGTSVGLSSINGKMAALCPYNEFFHKLSTYIGYFSMLFCVPYALIGAIQLVRSRSLLKVDHRILFMGVSLLLLFILYVAFAKVEVNFRPVVLPDEGLEYSFPSSHTMMGVGVFSAVYFMADYTARLIKKERLAQPIRIVMIVLALVMAVTRMLSGIHWFSDILAGADAGLCVAMITRIGVLAYKAPKAE